MSLTHENTMINIEKMEKQMAFFKRINEFLKADGIEEISQDSIGNYVLDSKREQTHEKAKQILEERAKKRAASKEAQQSIENFKVGQDKYQRNLYSHMDISGTKEAKEKNVEILKKIANPDGCAEIISDQLKKAVKLDFDNIYKANGSISNLVGEYEINGKAEDDAFIVFNFGTNKFGDYVYDPRIKQIDDNKGILEALNISRCAVELASKPIYKALPDEAFDHRKIPVIMAHYAELEKEFPDIIKEYDITPQTLSGVISDSGAFVYNRNVAKAHLEGLIPDPKSVLMEYHFEKDGKRVPFSEIQDCLQNGETADGLKLSDFKAVKNSKEEIDKVKEVIYGDELAFGKFEEMAQRQPYETSKEMQYNVAEKICTQISILKRKGDKLINKADIHETVYDKNRERQHQEALRIVGLADKQSQMLSELEAKLGVKLAGGPANRLVATYIDTSGTKEAQKFNEDLIRKASTKEGMLELSNKAIKEIINMDPKEAYSKDTTMDSYLEHAALNDARNRRCFILKSMIGENTLDYRLQEAFDKNAYFLETNESGKAVDFMATNLYKLIPDKMINDPSASEELLSKMPEISASLSRVSKDFEMTNLSQDLAKLHDIATLKSRTFTRDMVMQGKADMFKGEFKLEGKPEASFEDIVEAYQAGNKNSIKFEEFSKDKQKDIQEALKGDIIISKDKQKDNIGKLFDSLEGKSGSILDCSNDITKTHSIFSRDTKQFKEMEASLAKVVKLAKDMKEPTKKDVKTFQNMANDLKTALRDLKEKTTTYRDKKQKEKETQKKFSSRSQTRLDLANNLLKMVDNTLSFEKVVTNDNPFRKPLSMDRVQKLESEVKEKEIVVDKQKVINEPVKEVNLEQGVK